MKMNRIWIQTLSCALLVAVVLTVVPQASARAATAPFHVSRTTVVAKKPGAGPSIGEPDATGGPTIAPPKSGNYPTGVPMTFWWVVIAHQLRNLVPIGRP